MSDLEKVREAVQSVAYWMPERGKDALSALSRLEHSLKAQDERVKELEARLTKLEPLLYEVGRRAEKEWADDGHDFTVTIHAEMWQSIKDSV